MENCSNGLNKKEGSFSTKSKDNPKNDAKHNTLNNIPPSDEHFLVEPVGDFLSITKMIGIAYQVASLAKKGVSTQDLNLMFREKYCSAQPGSKVAINISISVSDSVANKLYSMKNSIKHEGHFKINDVTDHNNKPIVHISSGIHIRKMPDTIINRDKMQIWSELPKPCREPHYEPSNNNADIDHLQLPSLRKIAKRKQCVNCSKKKTLEELIRNERTINRQIEKMKHFWRGTHQRHPFIFKKKIMNFYQETNEVMISHITDYSKKMITAEENDSML